jgi:uncharacterized membrane protein
MNDSPSRARRFCATFFTAAGVMHFVIPKQYEAIVPPSFPNPPLLVQVSGVAEIVGGLALTRRPTRRFARWWLLGVLAAVYPANVQMAVDHERFEQLPRWALLARLPMQFVMAWWVWAVTRP